MKPSSTEDHRGMAWALVAVLGPSLVIVGLIGYHLFFYSSLPSSQSGREEAAHNGVSGPPVIDPETSESILVMEPGYLAVETHCAACHSLKLVTQNRADREGWEALIDWMQETQNLWDLGDQEETIIQYLSTHYGPGEFSRRKNLQVDRWYGYGP